MSALKRRLEALEAHKPASTGIDRVELVDPTTGRAGGVLHVTRPSNKERAK